MDKSCNICDFENVCLDEPADANECNSFRNIDFTKMENAIKIIDDSEWLKEHDAEVIEFIVKYIIFPLLDEYDIGLWEDIEYIDLADKWVEFKKKYKADDDSIIKELEKWIAEKLQGQKNESI